ncbi:MAG: Gfo/Idh/MocA family oxidoreductase [Lentisphaeria bacterium]|nr:Gfo/Idh/MocA family oxidoreductase [Lentisphaeria bacterium]
MKQVTLLIVGCGARGTGYGRFALANPERAKVVAIAEPIPERRNAVGDAHNVPPEYRFNSWEDAARLPRMADAVLICTQDQMHEEPAIAFAKLGYDILLEKPMAPTADSCRRIVEAVKKAGVLFAVCHVLRYTAYTKKLKEVLGSGAIGEIINIQHLEPVGYWHQAHSFVRGNWRNEEESSFMLLAKCCHDVDWLRYVMGRPCRQVQSFGTLKHFRSECAPAGAAARCLDCPAEIEKNCPYSAIKIYLRDRLDKGHAGWPVNVLAHEVTRETILTALRNGPYGRCVYACDNDVVDNQVVNMLFDNGSTVSMTMTAFNSHGGRLTRIFGTKGSIDTDSNTITLFDFLTDKKTVIDTAIKNDGGILSGHGGGDNGLMDAFISAVAEQDPSKILSGTDETLESHLMVFAAEESRKNSKVVKL